MKPETLARTSTVSTASKRPVYSSHSVMVFCSGRAATTDGGGGAAPAAGLPSQPTKAWAASNRKAKGIPRVIGFSSNMRGEHLVITPASRNRRPGNRSMHGR